MLKGNNLNSLDLRLYLIERNQNILNQYGRRDTIEITGIPEGIEQKNLGQEVIDIFKEAKVVVNRQPIKPTDIFKQSTDWVEVTQL